MKTKSMYLLALSFMIILTFITSSCGSDKKEINKITVLEKRIVDSEDTTDGFPKFVGDVHGGKYYSHTDSTYMYGAGLRYNLADSLVQKSIVVRVDMWARQNMLGGENQLAVALQNGDSVLNWQALTFEKYIKEVNKWTNVKDSIIIPGEWITKPGYSIKVFTFNPKGKPSLDSDDMLLTFCKLEKVVVED